MPEHIVSPWDVTFPNAITLGTEFPYCRVLRTTYDLERFLGSRSDAMSTASEARASGCDLSGWDGVSVSPTGEIILHW